MRRVDTGAFVAFRVGMMGIMFLASLIEVVGIAVVP